MIDTNKQKCIYCFEPIGDKAYSYKKVNNDAVFWHYLCYTNEATELVPIGVAERSELIAFLKDKFKQPYDGWQLKVLRSLGFNE